MRPYRPDTLPVENLDYRQLLPLVGQANAALARYDGLLQGIPNPALMLSPLTTREAVLSSIQNRIEMSTMRACKPFHRVVIGIAG